MRKIVCASLCVHVYGCTFACMYASRVCMCPSFKVLVGDKLVRGTSKGGRCTRRACSRKAACSPSCPEALSNYELCSTQRQCFVTANWHTSPFHPSGVATGKQCEHLQDYLQNKQWMKRSSETDWTRKWPLQPVISPFLGDHKPASWKYR